MGGGGPMQGLPRASWANLLASSPLMVMGLATAPTTVGVPFGIQYTAGKFGLAVGNSTAGGDSVANTIQTLNDAGTGLASMGHSFNESTWDRNRNNIEFALLASAARTVTTTTSIFTLYNAIGMVILLNVTINPAGAQTLTLTIRGYGPTATVAAAVLPANAFGGVAGNAVLVVYPGIGAAWSGGTGNAFSNTKLPRRVDIQVVPSGAGSWTYSVDGLFLL